MTIEQALNYRMKKVDTADIKPNFLSKEFVKFTESLLTSDVRELKEQYNVSLYGFFDRETQETMNQIKESNRSKYFDRYEIKQIRLV